MLVLTRRIGESIYVEPGIKIQLLSIKAGKRVKLGIDAPSTTRIWRSELRLDSNTEESIDDRAVAQAERTF